MNRTHFSPGLTPGCQKLLPVALMMLASTALAQPTWTDIMSTTNGTNEASGTYWEFSSSDSCHTDCPHDTYTETAGTTVSANSTLTFPSSSTGGNDTGCEAYPTGWNITGNGGAGNPPVYRYPQQRLTSSTPGNPGPSSGSYKGVGFLGTFATEPIGTIESGASLDQVVFFHEQPCFAGGREYGFYYDRYWGEVYAYWEVNANCGGVGGCSQCTDLNCGSTSSYSGTDYQVKNPLGYWSNAEYYFEMWPVTSGTADNNEGDTGSCSASACCFTVQIINTSYTTVFGPHTYSVPNPPGSQTDVIGIDPNFCTGGSGPNIGSEQGYVTAGLLYTPTITDLSSGNALILSRVFVGK